MNSQQLYRIIITSNEPWGDIWFSKQHYANELAKLGHEVYFVNSPKKWSIRNFFSFKTQFTFIQKNLTVIDYDNTFPLRINKQFSLWLNDRINEKKIYKNIPPSTLPILWWKFDPFRFVYISKSYKQALITDLYHVTDPFLHIFSNKLLAKKSKLVVTVLSRYQEYYEQLNQKKVLLIPHGISDDEFFIDPIINNNYTPFKNCILKIGTINDDYNIELLIAIATNFKDQQLVVVGPNKLTITKKQEQFNELEKLPNVSVQGSQKATLLKYYVHNASVCIVPYDFNIESNKGTPLKILNYLAQHKVSITSISTNLEHLLGKGIVKCNNTTEFMKGIDDALCNKIIIDKLYLQNYFKTVSYPFLIEQILHELEQRK